MDNIVINTIPAKVPDESFNADHAPHVLNAIKDLDSESTAVLIDLMIAEAVFAQVIDFLQRRRR